MTSMRSWAPPTADELDRVAVLCARPEGRAYFFDRLENPNWVRELAKRKFFANPPGPVPAEEPGSMRFPPWPEGRYLARVAAEAPDAVASVLQKIPSSENPAVTELLFKALANLPDDHITRLRYKAREWVSAPFADYFANEAAATAIRLLESGGTKSALKLVAQLLEVHPDPRLGEKASRRDTPLRESPEAVPRISKWNYDRVLRRLVGSMVDATGLKAIRFFARLLEDAVRLSRWENEESQDDYSYIWRPAIEDHEQNLDSDIKGALVTAVRDASIHYVTRNPDELEATIRLLESRSTVFRRIALYVLASITNGLELASARMTDRDLFDNHRVRHEYAALLRARFGELNEAEQSEILSWIEAGPDLDDYRQRRTASGDAPPTADEVASYADHWRRDRYSFIEDYLDPETRTRYRELVGSIGKPHHADFVSWSSSWVGPESPATAEQLSKRSVDEVIDYLRRWRPDDGTGRSFGPSIEGLSRVFSEVVAGRATNFAERAPNLSGLDPTYVRGFFSGLASALREAVTFPWAGPLVLALAVMEYPFEPDIEVPDRDRDPGWRWCRGQIGSLLRSGLTDKPNRVPFDLRSTTWEVIRRLTEDPNPSAEHEARYGGDNMDPLTLSINTNRGTAMHAVVEYALWCRRELESLGEDVSRGLELMPKVAEVLDRHLHPEVEASLAVRAVYGRWLPWLLLLDESWTIERLPLLFPYQDNEALAEAVWDTYIAWCPPYDSVFRALEEQYRAAIDRVPSNRKAGSFGHDSVDSKLGQHLVTLYWRRVIDREVLERYFARTDDQLAAVVMGFVGRALMNTPGELSASVAERVQDLWEWRFSETAPHPEEHALELRAFGIWFASGKLDARWALDALERTAELVGAPTLSHLVAERLAKVSEDNPVDAVRVFAGMVERPEHEWDYIGWRDEAKTIVEAALASGEADAEEPVASIIDFYVRRGELDLRELTRRRGA
jgi:hypothetical protein